MIYHLTPPVLIAPNHALPPGKGYIIPPSPSGGGGGSLYQAPDGVWIYAPSATPQEPDYRTPKADNPDTLVPSEGGADDE